MEVLSPPIVGVAVHGQAERASLSQWHGTTSSRGKGDSSRSAPVRTGGRLACTTVLYLHGVFEFDHAFPHIHLAQGASRPRSPYNRRHRFTKENRNGAELHWWPLLDRTDGTEFSVGLRDAAAHTVRCQQLWHAIATLDNALYLGVLTEPDLADVFAHLPQKYRYLRGLLDGRAEAGQEPVIRMILVEAGLQFEVQVDVENVRRVDFIAEGCLVIEADSPLAHDGWELHVRDRDRDINLAMQGYLSLRPAYRRTMYGPSDVRDAIFGLLRSNRLHIL